MVPGFGGHLVSELFLESHIDRAIEVDDAARRQLAAWRRRCRLLGPSSSVRAMFETGAAPLAGFLGFGMHGTVDCRRTDCAASIARAGSEPVGLVAVPWADRLDRHWRIAVTHALAHGATWCLLFNGTHLRIVDAARPYARRHTELDLDLAADDARTFRALWFLAHADRFARAAAGAPTTFERFVADSDRHASSVCRSLRSGVLEAATHVLTALVGRRSLDALSTHDSFEQALTIVYRVLFLLFAEARGLVPLWHPVYRESYSIEALRAEAERASHGDVGLWDALRAIARLAHAGCLAGDLRVTPFNGRLFAPARTPLAERRDLDDAAARHALLALSTRPAPDRAGRERIAYRDLGVEQLGAVYETLLDYEPRIDRPSQGTRRVVNVRLESGSGLRKATGTFYTPQPIAEYLVRRTLEPLVRDAAPDRMLALRIVDPAMGSGAFLVAACRYLAEAYENALIRSGGWHATDFGAAERASIRRTIAERCLYGVDFNPMAVQLARLSLWLATLAADRPLTFLDHHLQVGDSLIGAWLSALGRPPIGRKSARPSGATTLPFDDGEVRRAVQMAMPIRFSLEAVPDDTLAQVREKERSLAALARRDSALSTWKRVADAWCAAWFSADVPAAAFTALSDAIATGEGALPRSTVNAYLSEIETVSAARRFLHWELEFPEVFFDAAGATRENAGFDAVIGNPPWEMLRDDDGRGEASARALVRFTRDSGAYTAQSGGHANQYQLFLERALTLTRRGGRIGLVLPSGLAADHGSARLRARLLGSCDVDTLVGCDNRRGIFPIHRSVRFLLLAATNGAPTAALACRFGVSDPAELETEAGRLSLTPSTIERLSGPGLSIPDLRTPLDLAIAERCATLFAPLGDAAGWRAQFGREANATDDRRYFRAAGSGLPVVDGKHLEAFRAHLDASTRSIASADARRLLRSGRFERRRLAYRDVASATNRRTLIAALLPPGCVSTHTLFCLRTDMRLRDQHLLCGLLNSFVVDYLARQRVITHVTTAIVERLPVPTREASPRRCREIASLARRLSRHDDAAAAARLQALAAELYQLTQEEFGHVLGTFPLIAREERDAALAAFVAETQRGTK